MLPKLMEAAKRQRDVKNCEDLKEAVLSPDYRRKSPRNKKNTPQNQASLVRWLMESDCIINSPDKRDMKQKRDHFLNERFLDEEGNYELQQKYYYKTSKHLLWLEAKKPPDQGGWPDLHGPNGTLKMGRTTFDGLIPGYFKQYTKSQMRTCCCTVCENGTMIHSDYQAWARHNIKELSMQKANLEEWLKNNPGHKDRRAKTLKAKKLTQELTAFCQDHFIFDANNHQKGFKHPNIESQMKEMTCGPVNEKNLHPFKCCTGECENCPNLPLIRGENYEKKLTPQAKDLARVMVTYRQHKIS